MKIAALVVVLGCSDDRAATVVEQAPQRRVIEPPSGPVQVGPPYVIGPDTIGPYKLRQNVAALTDRLKGGPGLVRFEIPGLLHSGLMRAEEDTVLIGSEPSISASTTTTFLAVTGSEVAQLDSVHVGSSKEDAAKLGSAPDDPEHARDPRLLAPPAKNVRLVIDKKRVVAIVLTPDPAPNTPSVTGPMPAPDCVRPAATETAFGSCLTPTGELIEIDGDDIVVHPPDGEKPLARIPVPNLVFAVPLRNASENKDELVAITRSVEPAQRSWSMVVFRYETGQLRRVKIGETGADLTPLYQLSSSQTRWIGTDLGEIDLYLELTSRLDGIEVGGLLTTRGRDRIHNVVVISPITVARRHHKPVPSDLPDAGAPDAGTR